MGRSQETYLKKQREKKRAKKKQDKKDKKELRQAESVGAEIDWSSAPINETLTEEEKKQRTFNNKSHTNENRNS